MIAFINLFLNFLGFLDQICITNEAGASLFSIKNIREYKKTAYEFFNEHFKKETKDFFRDSEPFFLEAVCSGVFLGELSSIEIPLSIKRKKISCSFGWLLKIYYLLFKNGKKGGAVIIFIGRYYLYRMGRFYKKLSPLQAARYSLEYQVSYSMIPIMPIGIQIINNSFVFYFYKRTATIFKTLMLAPWRLWFHFLIILLIWHFKILIPIYLITAGYLSSIYYALYRHSHGLFKIKK